MNAAEVKNMSATDRLQIMETIWDSFQYEQEAIKSPQWHKDILAERKLKIDSGEAKFLSLKEVKARHQ